MKLVEAQNIPDWGGAFRKLRGEYVYLRVSKASAKFHGLDPNFVYGVCFNGNMTKVPLQQQVVQMSLKSMLENIETTESWERNVCGQDPQENDEEDKYMPFTLRPFRQTDKLIVIDGPVRISIDRDDVDTKFVDDLIPTIVAHLNAATMVLAVQEAEQHQKERFEKEE